MTNGAKPGFNIVTFLHNDITRVLPQDSNVELIIVDYGVNDAVVDRAGLDLTQVKNAHEILIRYVRNDMERSPALLYTESFISPHRVHQMPLQGTNMAEFHGNVTQKYDIPMSSFRHAVWPDINDSAFASSIWGTDVHPPWRVHQLLADTLIYYLQKSYSRFAQVHGPASDPSPEEEHLKLFRRGIGCLTKHQGFRLDTDLFVGTNPPAELVESTGWAFASDVRGIDGLIGFGNSSETSIVVFDLPCKTSQGVIDIAFLSSYSGMGAARVGVEGSQSDSKAWIIIDALWETSASITNNRVISIRGGFETVRVSFEVLSAAREAEFGSMVKNAFEEGLDRLDRKFKIVSIQCC